MAGSEFQTDDCATKLTERCPNDMRSRKQHNVNYMKTLLYFLNISWGGEKGEEKQRKKKQTTTKKDEKLNGSKCKTDKAPTVKVVSEFMKKTTVPLQSRVRFVTASVN